MSFRSRSGKLWRVAASRNGINKNIFVTAPDDVAAMEQVKTIDPSYQIKTVEETEYVICAPAPVSTVMWSPKFDGCGG